MKYANAVEACFNASQLKVNSSFVLKQGMIGSHLVEDIYYSVPRGR
jgi:hypothetical protein